MYSKAVTAVVAVLFGLVRAAGLAQPPASRDFEAEIEAALRSAKTAAGFEFLGTLSRICLLPASGGVNTSDNVPRYIRDPSMQRPRESWYADSARVFDNLFFVGGEGAHVVGAGHERGHHHHRHDLSVQLGGADHRRAGAGGARPRGHPLPHHLARPRRPHRRGANPAGPIRREGGDGGCRLGPRRHLSEPLHVDGADPRHRGHGRHGVNARRHDRDTVGNAWAYARNALLHLHGLRPGASGARSLFGVARHSTS